MLTRPLKISVCVLAMTCAGSGARAATIDYWRMETDTDANANTVTVANEIMGRPAMVSESTAGQLVASAPGSEVPATGASNLSSFNPASTSNGRVANYDVITGSVTVEFWAKTGNTGGQLVVYNDQLGSFETGHTGGMGFAIVLAAGKVKVNYQTDTGGGGTLVSLETPAAVFGPSLNTWKHIAWTYDQAAGVGTLYIDGAAVANHDGTDDTGLYWDGANDALRVGRGQSAGLLDELRISDEALAPSEFLNVVPEPAALAPLILGLALMFTRR